ncbi:MAG: ABC transporter substrate-binding protein [Candidatus Competibacteraceae bacterium]|nr:ABC transporter substrate-binding protein [Candidatus Competibacteraceae bacterium]
MRKVMTLLMAVCLFSLGFSASAAEKTLKLGVIAELTGDMPAVGTSCKNAAEMAVKEINAAGGVQVGKQKMKVELVVEDNAGKADQSAAAAQKLITQDEVLAIVGPNASRYAIPASEIAESSETVLITPWSTNPKTTLDATTNQPKKYVFRACFIDPFQGGVLAKFALENLKAKNAAVLYDVASDYNKGIAEVFKANYEKLGGKVVAFETYTTNDKDFSAQLTKIKDAKPDVIFLPNYYSEVPLQVQQAKRLGITVPFIGSDSWGSNELLTLGGADLNGYYFSTHYAADNAAPVAKKFIEDYEKTYGAKPDDVAALTYDAFGLLFGSIKSAGKADREAIRAALSTLPSYKGVTGDMKFTADSRDPIKSAVILQIKDTKFTYFTNANP